MVESGKSTVRLWNFWLTSFCHFLTILQNLRMESRTRISVDSSEVNHVTRLQKQAQLVELAFVIKTVVSGTWVAKCSVSFSIPLTLDIVGVKPIQELDVTPIPFDPLCDRHTSQILAALMGKSLLNIYVVYCEVRSLSYQYSIWMQARICRESGLRITRSFPKLSKGPFKLRPS